MMAMPALRSRRTGTAIPHPAPGRRTRPSIAERRVRSAWARSTALPPMAPARTAVPARPAAASRPRFMPAPGTVALLLIAVLFAAVAGWVHAVTTDILISLLMGVLSTLPGMLVLRPLIENRG